MILLKGSEELQSDIANFIELMRLEEEAETAEIQAEIETLSIGDAEKKGLLISKLEIFESDVHFGGRYYYRLRKNSQRPIGFSKITTGCSVSLVRADTKEEILRGIVQIVNRSEVKMVSEKSLTFDELKGLYQIHIHADNITYKRVRDGLYALSRSVEKKEESFLLHLLRGGALDSWKYENRSFLSNYVNSELNYSQQGAIQKVLNGSPLGIIHGPPGTGKTRTLLHLIKELVFFQQKLLVCAGTNTAIDFLAEGLVNLGIPVVRLGHPARVSEALYSITLERMLDRTQAGQQSLKLEKELAEVLRQKDKRIQKGRYLDREEYKSEKDLIYAYRKEIERQNSLSLLELFHENVVFCTTASGAAAEEIRKLEFDFVVLDEAAQILEPMSYLSLSKGKRFVLAGDHLQLPPTILSKKAEAEGLGVSFFERMQKSYAGASHLLEVQYRMHRDIAGFSSAYFYQGALKTVEGLQEEAVASDSFFLAGSVAFIDTAGADYGEEFIESRKSYVNKGEASALIRLIHQLLENGFGAEEIGVIVPYRTQAEWIYDQLQNEEIEVSTVDSFQGREKTCILISFTRSNMQQKIGFLSEERRLNVALTRAKRKLIMLGDSATLGSHPIFEALLQYVQNLNCYHSIYEFSDLM